MTKTHNNNTEQNIAITLLCATLWVIFAAYLLSLPVSADDKDYMISGDMQSYMETIGHGQDFELEDIE